jgi:molybdopterin converting factor small subunit
VTRLFEKGNWKSLELEEKKVYLWLEFLSFAHLMTEKQKNRSLACLDGPAVAVFNEAYDAVKLNFEGVTMKEIRKRYPDIYGYEEERLEKEQVEAKAVESAVNMIKVVANNPKLVQELTDQITPELQELVCKQLIDRKVVTGRTKQNLKDKINRLKAESKRQAEKRKKGTGSPKFTGEARPGESRQARRSSAKPRNS